MADQKISELIQINIGDLADADEFVIADASASDNKSITWGEMTQSNPTDTTAGRLMRADYGYSPGNILGTVSQSGGTPTGAVIERGSNGNGEYVRFADGTQMCWGSLYDTGLDLTVAWGGGFRHTTGASGTFPAAFAATPRIFAAANDVNAEAIPIYGDGGTTWFALRFWRATSATTDVSAQWLAIGRWF